jgi:betaine-aldehyde dehydrogenase
MATTKVLKPFIAKSAKDCLVVGSKQGRKHTLINPANAKPQHYYYHQTPSAELQHAFECAKQAQASWASKSPAYRASILRTTATIMSQNKELLSEMETSDTGRVIRETLYDVDEGVECLNYYAGLANTLGGEMYKLAGSNLGYTLREPLGLTVGIGAWNYPLQGALWKSVPSLAFGNGMIFKPSEYTPSTALWLAECYAEAGVPEGVFQVVLGDGQVGEELVSSELVSKISFTGSAEVGRRVYEMAARGMKKVTMELGGKSPLIIFDDADLDNAVKAAMLANFYSNGQVCSNGTRVFVHESIIEEFVERLVERTKKLRIGDPRDINTDIGPMSHKSHFEKVLRYVDTGVKEGASLLYGGTRVHDLPAEFRDGYFLTPAIFTNCTDSMTICKEEVFGMLVSILSFSSEEEVISRANNTQFGLAAGVFTRDIQRGHRVVGKLQAGVTWINNYNLAPMNLPWGGTKFSGIGRENGTAGVESWTQLKSVYVEMGCVECEYPK